MKVVICWPQIAGYSAACFRELASRDGVELAILAFKSGQAGQNAAFADDVMRGLNCRLLTLDEKFKDDLIAEYVTGQRPDIIVLPGWGHPPYVRLATHPQLRDKRFVMCMDTPRKDNLRQRLARLKVGRFIDRMDRVVVPGERSWQYARLLRVPEQKLRRGLYGIDYALLRPLWQKRAEQPGGWPKAFLYMGRYVADKAIDVMLEAYGLYRKSGEDPWPLSCCGKGPEAARIKSAEGVIDRGFVQPADQPELLLHHGVLVLASRYEPWGLVIVEACAAGLPVLCTEACSAAIETVRPMYNGLVVATDDAEAFAAGMISMHRQHGFLKEMGRRGQCFAEPYGKIFWADRWHAMFAELLGEPVRGAVSRADAGDGVK